MAFLKAPVLPPKVAGLRFLPSDVSLQSSVSFPRGPTPNSLLKPIATRYQVLKSVAFIREGRNIEFELFRVQILRRVPNKPNQPIIVIKSKIHNLMVSVSAPCHPRQFMLSLFILGDSNMPHYN